jgi:hypothetical protein
MPVLVVAVCCAGYTVLAGPAVPTDGYTVLAGSAVQMAGSSCTVQPMEGGGHRR